MEFIRNREEAGNKPANTNAIYGFPVVTRQEVELELMTVEQIESASAGRFEAEHSTIRPGKPEKPKAVRTEEQLALTFSE